MMRLLPALLLPLVLLSGCGEDADDAPAPATATAPNGDVYNTADVEFATEMIPHHAEALAMVDLTAGRSLDPEVTTIVDAIRDTQVGEIETMTDWLTAWDEPVPETVRDHANAHDGAHSEDLSELESAPDAQFQDLWLEAMIDHHEGAVEAAAAERAGGAFDEAVALAVDIEEQQSEEIDRMEALLGR